MTITIASQIAQLRQSIATVIKGKDEAIGLAIVALLARGHLLIEDVPGVGKTTLAHALARSFNCSFQRIQFTSDLLPSVANAPGATTKLRKMMLPTQVPKDRNSR